ncbi:hypothetical protein IUZ16_000548 [Salmonella enterica]|nr:hypothetical protein [Salmonella enterica]
MNIFCWRHIDAPASFLCRAHGYTSMVGWAGAPQGAPVANKAGKVNSVQFHHPRD